MKAFDYDPDIILPSEITLSFNDDAFQELEYCLSTAHALADVLERACEAEDPLCPQSIAVVLRLLRECYLRQALGDIRNDRQRLRILAERRAS
jgi:hypothetical protein